MKKIIAKTENKVANLVDGLIPILIAKVFTPSFLSPSISSHPLITSRDNNRKNDVKKNNNK